MPEMSRLNNSKNGQIKISDEVVAIIAGTAAREVEGVSNFTGDLNEVRGRKNLAKGVRVAVDGDQADIALVIEVKYGYKIAEVTTEVQRKVKNAIETMTALFVNTVNVNVDGVLGE